jgi:hypothetical protein
MGVGAETEGGKTEGARAAAVNRARGAQQSSTFPDAAGARQRLEDLDASLNSSAHELVRDRWSRPRLGETKYIAVPA